MIPIVYRYIDFSSSSVPSGSTWPTSFPTTPEEKHCIWVKEGEYSHRYLSQVNI